MIKVLIVDDHELVRSVIVKLLEQSSNIQIVAEANNGEAALQYVHDMDIDVVLLDISMPGISGLETTWRLMHLKRKLKVLILTSHEDRFYILQLLKIGAAGYLTKGASVEELIQAICTVYENKRYISPHAAGCLLEGVSDLNKPSVLDKLTHRELEIMFMICRGMKPNEIAEILFVTTKTVLSYRSQLYKKL
ncbi:MAG: response regulator transcription factor, partial [Pseudomonadota bacterium]